MEVKLLAFLMLSLATLSLVGAAPASAGTPDDEDVCWQCILYVINNDPFHVWPDGGGPCEDEVEREVNNCRLREEDEDQEDFYYPDPCPFALCEGPSFSSIDLERLLEALEREDAAYIRRALEVSPERLALSWFNRNLTILGCKGEALARLPMAARLLRALALP